MQTSMFWLNSKSTEDVLLVSLSLSYYFFNKFDLVNYFKYNYPIFNSFCILMTYCWYWIRVRKLRTIESGLKMIITKSSMWCLSMYLKCPRQSKTRRRRGAIATQAVYYWFVICVSLYILIYSIDYINNEPPFFGGT